MAFWGPPYHGLSHIGRHFLFGIPVAQIADGAKRARAQRINAIGTSKPWRLEMPFVTFTVWRRLSAADKSRLSEAMIEAEVAAGYDRGDRFSPLSRGRPG